MIMSVFGDESADETKQRAFSVSGVFGEETDWRATEKLWLEQTRGEEFHAADWEYQKRHAEYKALTQILSGSALCGVTSALDLHAFREILGETIEEVGYFKCLSDILSNLGLMAEAVNRQQSPNEQVTLEFTFDQRKPSQGNAGALYSMIANLPEWDGSALFHSKISFDCRTNPRIQMADLLAREAMKELDRKITGIPSQERRSLTALRNSGHFVFIERDRNYCIEWRNQLGRMMNENGGSPEGFRTWLESNRRVQNGIYPDNVGTRLQYMMWLESKPGLPPIFKSNERKG